MLLFPGQCQPIINAYTLANVTYAYLLFNGGRGFPANRLGLTAAPGVGDRIVKLRPGRFLQAQPTQRTANDAVIHKEFKCCF
jgi:hypothetical protein